MFYMLPHKSHNIFSLYQIVLRVNGALRLVSESAISATMEESATIFMEFVSVQIISKEQIALKVSLLYVFNTHWS